MARTKVYVVARGGGDRPVCQHRSPDRGSVTACGVDMTRWSLEFTSTRLDAILCKHPACRA